MTSEQHHSRLKREITRLKADFKARLNERRPVPHSVAEAYRKTIEHCENALPSQPDEQRDR